MLSTLSPSQAPKRGLWCLVYGTLGTVYQWNFVMHVCGWLQALCVLSNALRYMSSERTRDPRDTCTLGRLGSQRGGLRHITPCNIYPTQSLATRGVPINPPCCLYVYLRRHGEILALGNHNGMKISCKQQRELKALCRDSVCLVGFVSTGLRVQSSQSWVLVKI